MIFIYVPSEDFTDGAWATWLTFCKQHSQIHFLEWKISHCVDSFSKFLKKVPLSIRQYRLRLCFGTKQATSHYLNQRRQSARCSNLTQNFNKIYVYLAGKRRHTSFKGDCAFFVLCACWTTKILLWGMCKIWVWLHWCDRRVKLARFRAFNNLMKCTADISKHIVYFFLLWFGFISECAHVNWFSPDKPSQIDFLFFFISCNEIIPHTPQHSI